MSSVEKLHCRSFGLCVTLVFAIISTTNQISSGQRLTQDILRQPKTPQPQQQQEQQPAPSSVTLPPDFQLPPQLAQLTPQQLQQLAQLRDLQIQQQKQHQQQQQPQHHPSPMAVTTSQQNYELNQLRAPGQSFALGATTASMSSNDSQQDQQGGSNSPGQSSSSASSSDQSDRHDHDGSYTEANTEQEGVNPSSDGNSNSGSQSASQPSSTAGGSSTSDSAPAQVSGGSSSSSSSTGGPTFEVNWNKCPQLEPSESEKNKKTIVITKCLQSAPIPSNLTRENVEAHREQIATCALKIEGWFDDAGNYRYDKAESEIRSKKLDSQIEVQVLKFHIACKEEASKKFPREQNKLIDQVQFYQACMDYYISIACEIEVSVDS